MIVRTGEICVSSDPREVLVTYGLGSCIAVVAHDARAFVGGILHFMLPDSNLDAARAAVSPSVYADTGIPRLLHMLGEAGASPARLCVALVGGAGFLGDQQLFQVGAKNYQAARLVLRQCGIAVEEEVVGGMESRSVWLEVGSGKRWLRSEPMAEMGAISQCLQRDRVSGHALGSDRCRNKSSNPRADAIVIGASTGGTVVLENMLTRLPPNLPCILITQHIQAGFSRGLAERLNSLCRFPVREAGEGDGIARNRALIAPGGAHMVIRKGKSGALVVGLQSSPPVCHHRPSVDVLFYSAAAQLGSNSVGILLTGMGTDGALGLRAMREAGAFTVAQNEGTSVVYGMPREAVRLHAAARVLAVNEITALIAAMAR